MPVRSYSAAEVDRALARLDVVAVIEAALEDHARGAATLPAESYLAWPTPNGNAARSIAMHARIPRPGQPDACGVKMINASSGNLGRGLPRASGLTLLFDPETAQVETV